jgi:predicted O-methyltransferase YrrM
MIDLNNQNEWQHRCPETGLVLPWYTKSFLDELVTWELSDKVVLEYGCGASTLWWASKCRAVYAIENNNDWANAVRENLPTNAVVATHENGQYPPDVIRHFHNGQFDIVIVDNEPVELRDICIPYAMRCLKSGGSLIVDNWDQPSLGWVPSDGIRHFVLSLPHRIYSQEGHPDWKTLLVTKP